MCHRSCAGYCVITFILGIGDRHLENLMLKPTGHLWHLDFGFIFGQDPKPWPAPMRLTKEMVEGMGGFQSRYYEKFKVYCCQAYNILRKNSDLIINLLTLMVDAGLSDLSVKADPYPTLCKVQEKFRLDLNDEQGENYMLEIVEESVSMFTPVLMDYAHSIAVMMKK